MIWPPPLRQPDGQAMTSCGGWGMGNKGWVMREWEWRMRILPIVNCDRLSQHAAFHVAAPIIQHKSWQMCLSADRLVQMEMVRGPDCRCGSSWCRTPAPGIVLLARRRRGRRESRGGRRRARHVVVGTGAALDLAHERLDVAEAVHPGEAQLPRRRARAARHLQHRLQKVRSSTPRPRRPLQQGRQQRRRRRGLRS